MVAHEKVLYTFAITVFFIAWICSSGFSWWLFADEPFNDRLQLLCSFPMTVLILIFGGIVVGRMIIIQFWPDLINYKLPTPPR